VRQSGDQAVRLSVLGIRLPAMENTTFPRPSPLVEPGTRYRVPGVRYRIPGTWNRISGTGCGPTPRTEHRAQLLENAHPGYASCILHTPCAGFSRTGTRYRVHLAPGTWYPAPEPNRRRRPDTEHRGLPATGKRAHRVCILYPASHLQGGTHRPSPNRVKASVSKVRRCRKIMTNRASPTAASEAARTMTIEAMTCPSTEP
jgi:hypothetical protein